MTLDGAADGGRRVGSPNWVSFVSVYKSLLVAVPRATADALLQRETAQINYNLGPASQAMTLGAGSTTCAFPACGQRFRS
jgi:hypothetical protein